MGVIHKIKPEVLNFILENKQKNPALSCRNLTQLVLDKLQIKISKSSANAIFKENKLSMPVGRRQKHKKRKFNLPILPVIEGTRAVALTVEAKTIVPQVVALVKQEFVQEHKEAEESPEEKRVKEAQEWAKKLHEEESLRIKEKLELEKKKVEKENAQKKAEEIELAKIAAEASQQAQALQKQLEEEAKKLEVEKAAKRVAEEKRLAEEKTAQDVALKAEAEKWARLAEEDHRAREKETFVSQERNCSGAIFLKAIDCLLGGSKEINAVICQELGVAPEGFLNFTEAIIFRSLFGKNNLPGLGDLIGQQYSQEEIESYYQRVKKLNNIKPNIVKAITNIFTESRGLKMHFIDGTVVHLDGQLHSTWSTPYIPYDFSSTVYELKNNLNKCFFQNHPLILFSAPGFDVAPKDFFNLLINFSSTDKYPDTLTLFGNKLEEIEKISLNNKNKYSLLFGVWPWQFTNSRKVKKIGEFSLKHLANIDKDLYLAEIEIDLLRVTSNQTISLKGCAIKTISTEKIRLVVLNCSNQQIGLEEMAEAYLNRWPNFDEAFHDFSRKIELFAYVSNAQKFFSKDSFGLDAASSAELDWIFTIYIKILDAYLRWHFLPAGYTENDFSFTNKNLYKIPIKLSISPNKIKVRAQTESGYQFSKDLEYLSRRLNERQIASIEGRRFYFENAFK
jgi:hypothetical protein